MENEQRTVEKDPPWSCPKCPWVHRPHPTYGWTAADTRAIEVHRTRLCPARAGSARTLAEAWDEGFAEGAHGNPYAFDNPAMANPYRA